VNDLPHATLANSHNEDHTTVRNDGGSSPARDRGHCFTYGSLMFAEVMHAVAGMQPVAVAARLHGWERRAIRAANYPAAFPVAFPVAFPAACPGGASQPHKSIEGVLWLDLSAKAWQRLDAFEGADYERVRVTVHCGTDPHHAWVYAFRDTNRVLDHDWDVSAFRSTHLAGFFREHGRDLE
jgi:gamma-glutamylcyclotransferase (GGCT)/AIG2-like uncharacterized protein YtfP